MPVEQATLKVNPGSTPAAPSSARSLPGTYEEVQQVRWPGGPNGPENLTEGDYPVHSQFGEPFFATEVHASKYPAQVDGPDSVGLLARWQTFPPKPPPSKLILRHLPAAVPEIQRYNYLKPEVYTTRSLVNLNYNPQPDIRQTRFHRGFQRRHQTQIRQDAARMEKELKIQRNRDRRRRKNFPSFDGSVQSGWQNYRQDYDFNIFSGEGHGRVEEFKQLGKRIVNPRHTSEIFSEHSRDELNRQRNSINRYEKPMPLSLNRERQLASEGFLNSKKETMIIGYDLNSGPQNKMMSQGASDTYSHLRDGVQPTIPNKPDKNQSQIVFG